MIVSSFRIYNGYYEIDIYGKKYTLQYDISMRYSSRAEQYVSFVMDMIFKIVSQDHWSEAIENFIDICVKHYHWHSFGKSAWMVSCASKPFVISEKLQKMIALEMLE